MTLTTKKSAAKFSKNLFIPAAAATIHKGKYQIPYKNNVNISVWT